MVTVRLVAGGASSSHPDAHDAHPCRYWTKTDAGLLLLASGMGGTTTDRGADVADPVIQRIVATVADGGALAMAMDNANRWLLEGAGGDDRGRAASVAAIQLDDEVLRVINIGSTRVGLWRDSALTWLALDDTEVVCEHVLTTRALGLSLEHEVAERTEPRRVGDRVLMCSAAVYRSLGHAGLGNLLATGPPQATATAMAERAVQSGEQHATCVVADL